jgi:hypothetical protein
MAAVSTSLPPDLPDPPSDYDEAYMRRLVALLAQALLALSDRRPLIGSTLNLDRLPTSATGLRTGDVWNNAGSLEIV